MNWKALLFTIMTVVFWILSGLSCSLVLVVVLHGAYLPDWLQVVLGILSLPLAFTLVYRHYTCERDRLDLAHVKAIQKIEGTIVLKRGARGRFEKVEVR